MRVSRLRRRRMLLGHREGVDDEEVDAACSRMVLRAEPASSCHTSSGDRFDCRMNVPPSASPRSGLVWLNTLWSGETHDLDVFQLGVGDLHRLGAQRDVVVGRRAALLRAVFRRRLRVQVQHAGQDVGQQLAGRDGAVAAHRVEPDAERAFRQQVRVRLGLQRHQLGFGIGRLAAWSCSAAIRGRRRLGEELRAEIDERRAVRLLHVLEGGDQVARLQVVRAEAENRRGDARQRVDRRDAGMAHAVGVLARLEQRLRHQAGQRGDVGALQHRDGLLAAQRRDQLRFREGLQQLDRDHANLLALAAQMGRDRLGVVGDRAQADHHVLGVVAHEGLDRACTRGRSARRIRAIASRTKRGTSLAKWVR